MSKKIQKRTFRKRSEVYKPQTLGCPYCGGKAILRPTEYLFEDHIYDRSASHYYVCNNYPRCNTYISCQHGNFAPNGTLADSWLRMRRIVAHRYIDLIASNRIMGHKSIYYLIAGKLGLAEHQAHIRFSNEKNIEDIIAILRQILDNNKIGYSVDVMETPEYMELKAKGVIWEVLKNEAAKPKIKEEAECKSRGLQEAC